MLGGETGRLAMRPAMRPMKPVVRPAVRPVRPMKLVRLVRPVRPACEPGIIDQVKKNKRNGESKKGKAKTENLHTSQISSAYRTGTVSLRMFTSIGQ